MTYADVSYPDLGIYLQPDPEHRASARMGIGPQAYAYASGRPLVMTDPMGLSPGKKYETMWGAAAAATLDIKQRTGGWNLKQELCTLIKRCDDNNGCNESRFKYDAIIPGTGVQTLPNGDTVATCTITIPPDTSSTKTMAVLHNHPFGGQPSAGDMQSPADLFIVGSTGFMNNTSLNLSYVKFYQRFGGFQLAKSYIAELYSE